MRDPRPWTTSPGETELRLLRALAGHLVDHAVAVVAATAVAVLLVVVDGAPPALLPPAPAILAAPALAGAVAVVRGRPLPALAVAALTATLVCWALLWAAAVVWGVLAFFDLLECWASWLADCD